MPLFPYDRWRQHLSALASRYQGSAPFPHAHLVDFFDPEVAARAAAVFPATVSAEWVQYKHYNENKAGMTKRELFPPFIGSLVDELNSPAFLEWLSELTGIDGLLADSSLEGGGMHQSGPGGFLNVHADFTMHHHQKHWRRRVNVIVYLNREWDTRWGGAIELWDQQMSRCVVRVPPLFNHAVIFNTDETSYHGFPDPLTCPAGVSRRSLALYYYTLDEADDSIPRSTNYQSRPGDTSLHTALIWADKQAVHLYSKLKSALGLSDDFASRTLGAINERISGERKSRRQDRDA